MKTQTTSANSGLVLKKQRLVCLTTAYAHKSSKGGESSILCKIITTA